MISERKSVAGIKTGFSSSIIGQRYCAALEKLYLLFVARGQDTFGFSPATVSSVNEKYGYFVKNWDEGTQTYKTGLSYIAVDMGDIQADAVATIKYDHIDKIEYLDNYIIQMFIPNKFND